MQLGKLRVIIPTNLLLKFGLSCRTVKEVSCGQPPTIQTWVLGMIGHRFTLQVRMAMMMHSCLQNASSFTKTGPTNPVLSSMVQVGDPSPTKQSLSYSQNGRRNIKVAWPPSPKSQYPPFNVGFTPLSGALEPLRSIPKSCIVPRKPKTGSSSCPHVPPGHHSFMSGVVEQGSNVRRLGMQSTCREPTKRGLHCRPEECVHMSSRFSSFVLPSFPTRHQTDVPQLRRLPSFQS